MSSYHKFHRAFTVIVREVQNMICSVDQSKRPAVYTQVNHVNGEEVKVIVCQVFLDALFAASTVCSRSPSLSLVEIFVCGKLCHECEHTLHKKMVE